MSNTSGDTKAIVEKLLFEDLDWQKSLREWVREVYTDDFFKYGQMFIKIKLKDNK